MIEYGKLVQCVIKYDRYIYCMIEYDKVRQGSAVY